jgi:hypothetical protein
MLRYGNAINRDIEWGDMKMVSTNNSSLPGLTRQSIRFEKSLVKIDGCAGQARA